jgi:serine phosphatase RsbU (regulator of sigma subunit)
MPAFRFRKSHPASEVGKVFTRRFYDIIERLQAGFEGERKFSIELLDAILSDFRQETCLSGGRVWEKTPGGYRCIREIGTRAHVGDDFLFPLAQIPLEQMRQHRLVHLAKGDPFFEVPAQQPLEVESVTAFPVDENLNYIIALYFERSEDFASKRGVIESFLRIVGLFTSNLAASRREGEFLGEILELAHRQQSSLLPEAVPVFPGFDIHGASEPFAVVGGDYFRFFDLFGPLLGVCIADVKGKGFSAAVQVTALHRVLAVLAQTNLKIAYKAHLMNQAFFDAHSIENLIALVYGELGPDGRFHYANMAHVYPLWYRRGADEFIELEEGGPFLGLQPDAVYGTGIVILEPGDFLVLYTDGITEISDESGEEYGRSRLKSLVRDGRDLAAVELTERIFQESRAFSGTPGRVDDDRTVVVIRRLG